MFKTILLQIDGGAGQASRLRAAAVLAEMHGAHLVGAGATGISLANYAVLNGSMAAPLSDRAFEALRDNVRIRLDAFIEQAQRFGIAGAEARLFEGSTHDGLLQQSRYADLIVVSQPDPNDRFGAEHGLPQTLALGGTRPVLVVPTAYDGAPIAANVLVGWDGSMPPATTSHNIRTASTLRRNCPVASRNAPELFGISRKLLAAAACTAAKCWV